MKQLDEPVLITTDAAKRQVRAVISTNQPDRTGDVVVPSGCDTRGFLASGAGPILWGHDHDKIIASCPSISIGTDRITAVAQFPKAGAGVLADRIFELIQAGTVRSTSIGFLPTEMQPVDPKNPRKGQRITKWDLLEWSFVSVPANPGAIVQRSWQIGKAMHWDTEGYSVARSALRRQREADLIALGVDPDKPPLTAQEHRRLEVAAITERGAQLDAALAPKPTPPSLSQAERQAELRRLGII